MNTYKTICTAVILMAVSLFACKKDSASTNFDKSYDAFKAYKTKVNNTYAYTAVTDDNMGNTTSTKITVTNGAVTARDFFAYQIFYNTDNPNGQKTVIEEWHETATSQTLGTHGAEGLSLYTLDDIYYRAQNIWLKVSLNSNTVSFEANNNGMISVAGYTPKSCQSGDCFIGIKIQSITP